MCIGRFRCADDLLIRCIWSAITDIIDDRSRKQVHILLHNTNFIAQILQFHIADILSIQ